MADNDTQNQDSVQGGDTGGTPQGQAPGSTETFSREYVEELRRENAKHRTAKNEAVAAAREEVKAEYEAKLAEKDTAYAELQNQLGQAWIELEKVYTALDAKVPNEKVRGLVKLLEGTDKESISESVKSAIELFGGWETTDPAVDHSQGKGGGGKPLPLNGDKLLQAVMQKINS